MALYEVLEDGTPRKVAGSLKDYTAGNGISIDNGEISIDSEIIKTYSMVPSSNYEDMGINFSTTGYHPTYTAPANGYVHIYFVGSASYLWVANRNANFECSLPNRANSGIVIPVSKGDVIQFYSDKAGNTTYSYSRFIYAKE